jgi:hypothetical protein
MRCHERAQTSAIRGGLLSPRLVRPFVGVRGI